MIKEFDGDKAQTQTCTWFTFYSNAATVLPSACGGAECKVVIMAILHSITEVYTLQLVNKARKRTMKIAMVM